MRTLFRATRTFTRKFQPRLHCTVHTVSNWRQCDRTSKDCWMLAWILWRTLRIWVKKRTATTLCKRASATLISEVYQDIHYTSSRKSARPDEVSVHSVELFRFDFSTLCALQIDFVLYW